MKQVNNKTAKAMKHLKRPFKRRQAPEERASEAFANVPRITNETVAEHREEVLSSARKYIYPLRHSKHRVVRISILLLIIVVVGFFAYCGIALYKLQSTSSFIYGVTQVIPFPVAKAGPSWVSYESYLFELRRNMHYYQTQQFANFSTANGKTQLTRLKQQAMAQVVQNAYVKELAGKNHVTVSSQAVNNEVALVRSENRLGSSQSVFNDVLDQFWGWNQADFERELKQQLLQQAVVVKLDTATTSRAQTALIQLNQGADFGTVALTESDDAATKASAGQYSSPITRSDQSVAPQVVAEVFLLKPGQISPIINTGYALEILKVLGASNNSVQAAHIEFDFNSITLYTNQLEAKQPVHIYLKV
jgi:parvulin-like peptidyl-prolyl isomerase